MKPYTYLLLVAVLSAFGSCSKEAGEDPNTPTALEARIAGVSLVTRGGAADAADISSLGLYAVNATSGENLYGTAPAGTQRTYKLTHGTASPESTASPDGSDQTLWLNLQKATIFSFHPASTSVTVTAGGNATTPDPTIPIPAAAIGIQQASIAGSGVKKFDYAKADKDYMYGVKYDETQAPGSQYLSTQPVADNGRAPVNAAGNKISIGLKHAFAQIKLEIVKGDYPGAGEISSVTYKRSMQMLKSDGSTTMSLKNGTLANLDNAADITYSYGFSTCPVPGKGTTMEGDEAVTIINYVVPNAQATSILTITVDGKTMTMTQNDVAWTAGSIYTYTIKINGTGLELDGIHLVPWNDNQQPGVII